MELQYEPAEKPGMDFIDFATLSIEISPLGNTYEDTFPFSLFLLSFPQFFASCMRPIRFPRINSTIDGIFSSIQNSTFPPRESFPSPD